MKRSIHSLSRPVNPITLAAVLVACGAVAGCSSGPDFTEDGGLQVLPVVDGSVPPPPTTTGDAATPPPHADGAAGDAAPEVDAGHIADARADVEAHDAQADVETIDAGIDAPVVEDAALDSPPPPVDAGVDAPLVCMPGYADCDGDPGTDCETNLVTDPKHCGSCGHDCTGLPHVSGPVTCGASGACVFPPSSCQSGYGHCTSNPDDGCETDLSQPTSCGACNVRCTGGTPVCSPNGAGGYACSSGCPSSAPTRCGSQCVDTTSDPNHCGSCTTSCSAPADAVATCSVQHGTPTCGFTCDSGYHACGGACDSNTSTQSCGTSCTPCTPPANAVATCDGTSCGFTCDSGFHQCGAACDSNSSPQSCGTSCTPCTPPPNATATCDGTSCGFACDSGFHQCGSACDSNSSTQSCGASCTPCAPPAHAEATCDGTSCGFVCDSGYTKCSATACDDLANDPNNCGACGHTCQVPDGQGNMIAGTCSAGACQAVPIAKVSYSGTAATAPMLDDGGRIVFVGGVTIYGLWNAGAYPAPIVTASSGTLLLGGVAADATNYYFSQVDQSAGYLMAVPKAGGTPINKYSSTGVQWFGVAVGGPTLYATDYTVFADSWALPSGTPKPAPDCTASGCRYDNVFGVAADANGAYLSVSGNKAGAGQIVNWVGGNPLATTSLPAARLGAQGALATPYDIAIDATNVYWVANDAGATTAGTLMQTTRVVGGTPITLASGQGTIVKIAVANGYVYWTTAPATGVPGSVRRAKVGTTNTVETLATEADPWGIVVEGGYVYWTSLGNGSTSVRGLAL